MIDNFELIKQLFYFNEDNNMFFHLQILKRGKEHPELPAANKLIQSCLVRSREELAAYASKQFIEYYADFFFKPEY